MRCPLSLPRRPMSYYRASRLLLLQSARQRRSLLQRPRLSEDARLRQGRGQAARALAGAGKVRVNQAGCLDRCDEGPVIVVYPEEVWYTYVDQEDVDEIIEEHLRQRPAWSSACGFETGRASAASSSTVQRG